MSVTQILADEAETSSNPYVPLLKRLMREQRPLDLEKASAMLAAAPHDAGRLAAAEAMIREQMEQIRHAQEPRAVVAGGIESWYFGPRPDDIDWPALVRTLADDGWSEDSLKELDKASTKIVAHLPNPVGADPYTCRGLVLGYVQSGKTTNFTAVIAKAADAGYRLIVVLSGLHEGLRWQTQDRLNEQLYDAHPERWNRLTSEQDFLPTYNVDATLAGESQRTLVVIKKNASRLRAFRKWLRQARPEQLDRCPVLIIDDEADQATVNTARPDQLPKTINRLIKSLVNDTPRSAYVGYTATPFANVLIDPDDDDLYPRDFIVDLPRPDAYLGPEAIFGRDPLDHDDEPDDGHDMVRTIPTDEIPQLRPPSPATRHAFEQQVTPSLDAALRYFLLSTAARRHRGRGNPHATALVHTSQHVDVHERTAAALSLHLKGLAARLAARDEALSAELAEQWAAESARVPAIEFAGEPIPYETIAPLLAGVTGEVEVVTDNSRSPERLHFDDDDPRVIVAVGGNTLSRGLTLEGLAVSFFVRTASAYDTLLQMGRWFGYRNGYADLTRIWLTDEMRDWFRHLALVEAEIRQDITAYELDHRTPLDLAVRIQTHPQLAITAAAKMRGARPAQVSYSGRRLQTILFHHRDADWLAANLTAGRSLLNSAAAQSPARSPRNGVTVFDQVDLDAALTFLDDYRFHENSRGLNSAAIADYLRRQNASGHLPGFTVAVIGRHPALTGLGTFDLPDGKKVGRINRAPLDDTGNRGYADIKALMSRDDRVIDLPDPYIPADMAQGEVERLRNTPAEGGRGTGTALLALYPISPDSRPARGKDTRRPLDAVDVVLGVGLVFPTSPEIRGVRYYTADLSKVAEGGVEAPDEDDRPDEPDPR